jgi:hypothetical protein
MNGNWSIILRDGFRNRPYSLRCDFTVSYRSNAFLRVIRLMVFVNQLAADLPSGSRVSCHSFLALCVLTRYLGLIAHYFVPEMCDFACRQPVCRSYRGCKLACRFIGFAPDLFWNIDAISSEVRL